MAKIKAKHARKSKSFFNVLKHWLEKRGQGLPMTTIVIIVIVLIVLAVVVVFFFGQFSTGQTAVTQQQEVGTSATHIAKCNAWGAGILPQKPCGPTEADGACPKEAICNYYDRTGETTTINCLSTEDTTKVFVPSDLACK